MKIKKKVQRRAINFAIASTIICLTPFCEGSRTLSGAHTTNAFAGEELVCAIDLGNEMFSGHVLETGLSYRLLNEFAADNHCNIRIIAADKSENYIDSLKQGSVDLVITNDSTVTGVNKLTNMDDRSIWVTGTDDLKKNKQLNNWIGQVKASGKFKSLENLYSGSFNPHKKAEKGIITNTVSPYDEIIRKHARTLGWDWRMVAAVVYQESKFSINSKSSRGAQGLMQVMPQTGDYYGIDNLLDPEQNIVAGTNHLNRLQKIFSKYGLEHDELIRFTLAAYNAGEGRILDCRNLAAAKGYDNNKWEEIVKVIPLMRDESILKEESVKLGQFQGHETIAYIESVLSHYQAICQICPTSL